MHVQWFSLILHALRLFCLREPSSSISGLQRAHRVAQRGLPGLRRQGALPQMPRQEEARGDHQARAIQSAVLRRRLQPQPEGRRVPGGLLAAPEELSVEVRVPGVHSGPRGGSPANQLRLPEGLTRRPGCISGLTRGPGFIRRKRLGSRGPGCIRRKRLGSRGPGCIRRKRLGSSQKLLPRRYSPAVGPRGPVPGCDPRRAQPSSTTPHPCPSCRFTRFRRRLAVVRAQCRRRFNRPSALPPAVQPHPQACPGAYCALHTDGTPLRHWTCSIGTHTQKTKIHGARRCSGATASQRVSPTPAVADR